ncbi:MAG: hypothetical protein JNN28_06185 [Saprospiraceae bacterium]|nr:hypothetical protein [Saprospiraceae bacterium]
MPYSSYALTGGPSQPEVQSFEPIGTSEMVDVSSGSFTYNIPLMEVGGYPINLAYHSGVGMDDEASCMGGLGWNINVGVINRNMRGLPDDFDGDIVEKELNMKDNFTWGGRLGVAFEIFGMGKGAKAKGKLGLTLGGFWNSYKGVGLEFGVAPSFSASVKGSTQMTLGLGLSANSASGVSFSPQIGLNFEKQVKGAETKEQGFLNGGISVGTGFNSRKGLQSFTFGASMGISAKNIHEFTNLRTGVTSRNDISDQNSRSLYGGSATYDFVAPTYSPGGQFSYLNQSINLAFTIGGEIWGNHPSASISGYYSNQSLQEKEKASPGYGYLYAQNAKNKYDAVQDFNREKDMAYTENTPNLPIPVPTNDVYSAAGQGIAGSYQLKRGDVGVMYDPPTASFGNGYSLGGELGLGNTAHGGVDLAANFSESYTSAWTDNNYAFDKLAFQSKRMGDAFEPAYFKIAGEKAAESDQQYWNDIGGTQLVSVALDGGSPGQKNVQAKDNWAGHSSFPTGAVARKEREKRNQPITFLTAKQASQFGLEKNIISYKENIYGQYLTPTVDQIIPRSDATVRKAQHISEITVLRQDGLRYLYGVPAYNTKQVEVGFSVNSGDCSTGITNYQPNVDNTKDNKNGTEYYFNKTTLPPYVHAWLLTAVLSPDYVDVTGDGPSPDDLGTYTKFRYTRVQDNYCWRAPFEANTANYNEGFKSDPGDDKANYLYGEKEYWLLHSVESKTQLAEFYYGKRDDGLGVEDENGGKDMTKPLKKLEKIVLFSLPDRRNNGINAEPIKTVHFDYNYELLPGIPNTSSPGAGKLTLKALSFTFGRSQKGKLSPYKFFYKNVNSGYQYNIKAYNRWGTYQPNQAFSCDPETGQLSNADFPYVPQDNPAAQNDYVAWQNLNEIRLPSGGVIKVEYESNDYAFVQNSRAMEMVKLAGFGQQESSTPIDELYNSSISSYDYLFFDLPSGQEFSAPTAQEARAEIGRRYLKDSLGGGRDISPGGYLYFKCLINLNKAGKPKKYEHVPGYTQVDDYGAIKTGQSSKYNRAFIKLQRTCIKDKESKCSIGNADWVNPFSKAAWQYARLNLPRIAYGEPDPTASGGRQILQAMGALVQQYGQFFGSFNRQMLNQEFAKEVISEKSWIRLFSPTGKKIGGGVRVKKVIITDEWQSMAGAPHQTADYGQEYSYTTVERGDTISSGVANYEPLVGGEENPFRQPIFYNEAFLLAPDNSHFQEHPYGESYFPAPQIVYSEVTVRNLPRPGVTRNATGRTVYKYYTSRDFPTKFSDTGVRAVPKRTNPIFALLKIKMKDYMNAAQGFLVETNDMPGKPRSRWIYDESNTAISGIEYNYKTDASGLNNEVQVLMPDGKLAKRNLGLECSVITDSREAFSFVESPGVQLNFDGFLTGIFPTLAVIPWPSYQSEELRFRSMVTAKLVRRYGLLQSMTAFDLGSKVSTENLAWDSETGEVIVTKTYNEHDDPLYSVNFPAHWAYRGMQAAYKNLGAVFNGAIVNGFYYHSNATALFMPGDEVAITNGNYAKKGWVKDVNNANSTGQIYIVDETGQPINTGTTACNIEVIRSGYRNQQLSSVGSVTCRQLPFDATGKLDFQNKQVLNASAVEYDERWQTWCGTKQLINSCDCTPNPVAAQFFTLLKSQLVSLYFVLYPKTAPLNISGLPIPDLKTEIDARCGAAYAGTNNFVFASELVGNDLVCYFGKTLNGQPTCWFSCITIPNFAPFTGTSKVILGFLDFQPNKTDCNGNSFCFKVDTEFDDAVLCGASCIGLFHCYNNQQMARCGWQAPGDVVNPYRLNILGNFRPKRTWTFLTDRVQQPVSATALTNTRTDGYYTSFSTFWEPKPAVWVPRKTGWTWAAEVTRFNPTGNEVENRDALDRYSAELNGYANTQVTAVANNARYRQIAFEGFEDYNFNTYACSRHFEFPITINDTTSQTSHTGKYSVQVQPTKVLSAKYSIRLPVCPPKGIITEKGPVPFKLYECDCIGKFSPDPGKYLFSAWLKEDQPIGTINYNTAEIEVKTGGQSFKFKPSGQVIEGWQRVFGEFTVPSGATDIEILLAGNTIKTWFDDIRIQPFDASMKSFVYDERSLRFTYELDENNFFTHYEYDAEGRLELVKKETEKGWMTVQESKVSQKKQ